MGTNYFEFIKLIGFNEKRWLEAKISKEDFAMNIISTFRTVLLLGLISLLTACLHDDDSGSAPGLDGTWFGTLEDSGYVMSTVQVTISGNTITSVYEDGYNMGITGTITQESSNIGAKLYSFVLSDTTEGGFYADDTKNYIAFIDDDASFGVLQKGATALPTYTENDIISSWSGYTVELDSWLNITDEYNSAASVDIYGYVTSTNPYATSTGSITTWHSYWGYYEGSYSNLYESGNFKTFMSPDKQFMASWACSGSWPSYCSFSAWSK